jgi:hypothetical protein
MLAVVSILAAWHLGAQAGLSQYTARYGWLVALWIACQLAAAAAVFQVYRRGGYAWLAVLAAIAVPLFDPGRYPAEARWLWRGLPWRLVWGGYVLLLLLAALWAVCRLVRRTDELERHVNKEALAIAFGATVVLVLAWALFEELLPPLRPGYVVVLMVAGWLAGGALTTWRYR